MITAKCIVNRSIKFRESESRRKSSKRDYANESKTKHNQKWPYIPDNPHRILIKGGSGSEKTNAFLNLINNQPDIVR